MKHKIFCSIFSCVLALFILSACHTTSAGSSPSQFAKTLRKANKDKNSFLMLSGVDTFIVTHLMIENKRRDMTVQLNRMDSAQRTTLRNTNATPIKQVLLFMRDSTSYTLEEPHTIPVSRIAKIEVKE